VSHLLLFNIGERKLVEAGEAMLRENKLPGIMLNASLRFTGLPDLILFFFILTVTIRYLLGLILFN
jgi:hypothetical protein